MNAPLVSIVLCTYNGEKYIDQQLTTICAQSYTNLEIIISDDASTDNTYSIVKAFSEKDKRIRLFQHKSNVGFIENFNAACVFTTGDYIAFSDQDDVWHKEKIEKLISSWPEDSPLIYCDSQRFSGNDIPWNRSPKKNYRRFAGNNVRELFMFNTISGHALLLKKSLLSDVFPVEKNIFYDWKAGVYAACNGGVTYLPETLVFQRLHDVNVSTGSGFHLKTAASKKQFKQMVIYHLNSFFQIQALPANERVFIEQLSVLLKASFEKKFSFPLFLLLLKNHKSLMAFKKSRFPILSRLKYCYRIARN